MLRGLDLRIAPLEASAAPAPPNVRTLPLNQQAAAAVQAQRAGKYPSAGQYPGIEVGADVMINGPVAGGPSPIPTFIEPHSIIIGEGSAPVKLLTFTNGQIPIGATGADPAAANITGAGRAGAPFGVAVINGANTIGLALNSSVQSWITGMQAWAQGMQSWATAMQTWANTVSGILDISPPNSGNPPNPAPPASGPT
jgi:hypothetical protein